MVEFTPTASEPPTESRRWLVLGGLGLLVAYVLVFSLTGLGATSAILNAVANVAPAVLLGALVCSLVQHRVIGRPVVTQIYLHLVLATAFIGLWYLALIPLLAIAPWVMGDGFYLTPLSGPALPWQLFQGLMIYAVLAAATYAVQRPLVVTQDPGASHPTRYLMRQGEDIRPVEVAAIVTIQGADDYAEVTTAQGRHLARKSLTDFERELDAAKFVRVHRSWIINFDRLTRAEPAGGGRMLAHMQDGQIVPTSRAGARVLRDRLV